MKDALDRVTPELPMVDAWPFPQTIGKPGDACRPPSSNLARYTGGKNGAGVFQKIINAIPAHETYVEAFAGSAAVFRRKKPADVNFLIEKNPTQAKLLKDSPLRAQVFEGDALDMIDEWLECDLREWFFYLDPPYLHSTRKDATLYGDYELTDESHWHLVNYLLPKLTESGAMFALSGYRSAMYDDAAAKCGWHRIDYQTRTRRGTVTESLWTNYDPGEILPADLTWSGDNFRERERLKRKAARWTARLLSMPTQERAFLRAALSSLDENGEGA